MAYKIGTMTLSSSGLQNINLGTPTAPTSAMLIVQNRNGVVDIPLHVSMGTASVSGQRCTSYIKDSIINFNIDSTTKCISHYENVGGAATEVLSAAFDSFSANGIRLNVTIPNNTYKVYIRVDY